MALIQLNFGREGTDGGTDDTDDADVDRVEIPIDGEDAPADDTGGNGGGRGLFRLLVLAVVVAGAGYLLYRRAMADDETEFAEIVFEDETAEAGPESTEE